MSGYAEHQPRDARRDRTPTTYATPGEAEEACRRLNRGASGGDVAVIVDGPGDDELTVMPLRDAIETGLLYRWAA